MSILAPILTRRGWSSSPLGRLAPRIQRAERPDLPTLSVFLGEGVVPRASREDNHNRLGEDLARYLVVQPGDIVFNKLRTWQGGLGVSRYEGIVSPAYFVCRPRKCMEPRYLHYVLRSAPYLQELTRISKWMPPSQFDISWDQLRTLPVPQPPLSDQCAIADYLDAETARIDALIEKKRRIVELLEEKRASLAASLTNPLGCEYLALRHYSASAADGPFGSALKTEHYSDGGARVIRLGNIGVARWRDLASVFIPLDYWATLPRHHAERGDVVIAGLGDEGQPVGRSCVVPIEGPALVKADCYRVRVHRDLAEPRFLAWYLSSPRGLGESERRADGSTRPRLTLSKALALQVPHLEIQAQRTIADRLDTASAKIDILATRIVGQIGLLAERRQALITAAVTGELAIPGIAA